MLVGLMIDGHAAWRYMAVMERTYSISVATADEFSH